MTGGLRGPPSAGMPEEGALRYTPLAMISQCNPAERRPRVFSGVQPSGALHIGNYLGAIRHWVQMQETHDCLYCVVDLHAITVRQERKALTAATLQLANILLAAGIDPERSILFVQSHVPAHSELAWILNTITYFGELRRMTQFKEKGGGEQESVGVGLFDYPVLMAADILLYGADHVPVGDDQKQHVELTRDIAQRFNREFGKTFVIPEPVIREEGRRIMSLDNPANKMSKSAASPGSYIALLDPPDVIRRKIRRAVTDSGTEIRATPDKPALTNLVAIHSIFSGLSPEAIEERYAGKGYADFKRDLGDLVADALAPFQRKVAELTADPAGTRNILREGACRAEAIAARTMERVRERVGLVPRPV